MGFSFFFYAQLIVTGIDTKITTAVIYFVCIFYSALVTTVSIYLLHTQKNHTGGGGDGVLLWGDERFWKATI